MGEWLPKSGHRIADGMSYEIYRNTPMEVPESDLRTELYVPITGVSAIHDPCLHGLGDVRGAHSLFTLRDGRWCVRRGRPWRRRER